MKSINLAVFAAACLSTSAFALPAGTMSDADKDKLIDKCVAKGTLDTKQLDGLSDDQVVAKLQDCAKDPAPAAAVDPAPVPAPSGITSQRSVGDKSDDDIDAGKIIDQVFKIIDEK